MKFKHAFEVEAPLSEVWKFHSSGSSLKKITPPPVYVQIHHVSDEMKNDDLMDFTLWLGPFPIHWIAKIEDVSPGGFRDVQIKGPYASWVHRHSFIELSPTKTLVNDEVEYELRPDFPGSIIGKLMSANLNFLFAYRKRKTRQLLEKKENN